MKTPRGIALLRPDPFTGLALTGSTIVLLFILLPLAQMILQSDCRQQGRTELNGGTRKGMDRLYTSKDLTGKGAGYVLSDAGVEVLPFQGTTIAELRLNW